MAGGGGPSASPLPSPFPAGLAPPPRPALPPAGGGASLPLARRLRSGGPGRLSPCLPPGSGREGSPWGGAAVEAEQGALLLSHLGGPRSAAAFGGEAPLGPREGGREGGSPQRLERNSRAGAPRGKGPGSPAASRLQPPKGASEAAAAPARPPALAGAPGERREWSPGEALRPQAAPAEAAGWGAQLPWPLLGPSWLFLPGGLQSAPCPATPLSGVGLSPPPQPWVRQGGLTWARVGGLLRRPLPKGDSCSQGSAA